ncbi:hypothetical protein KUH03_37240 [Sphingobacterium sp. E70]|uniref:hypothetical protein n=1 Tax=Sphingobacterium sp. E70 TaxID=2853439 RepID=UPI00211CECBF|nr:hypothetical protein [Sphingobacterium sp. E70]ULT24540.1 hypothetical protein KUH03_37240 [Sphingobacterium sp. E70]
MDITQELTENQRATAEINARIKSKVDQKFEIEKLLLRLQSLQVQQNDVTSKIQANKSQKSAHLLQFTWPAYSSTDESIYTQKNRSFPTSKRRS